MPTNNKPYHKPEDYDFEKIWKVLEEQGWEPKLCDTPVPYYDNPAQCGTPTEIGDAVRETEMVPRDFLTSVEQYYIKAKGDSMKDAEIADGDKVMIEVGSDPNDGDIVLVWTDGATTLKSFCEDDNGVPWLVPQNRDYDAFPLSDFPDAWIMGIVRQIVKSNPRVKYRTCMKLINEAKMKRAQPEEISQLKVSQAIREIAPRIEVARHWYAVYRAMADRNIVREDDFDAFIELVTTEVPNHPFLPRKEEMQRLAVLSFAKPLYLWRRENAPVKGKRFGDYLKIAHQTTELLDS